jgi:murein DD-endopeptidase MepM/ murein hydrolase activator NlpD
VTLLRPTFTAIVAASGAIALAVGGYHPPVDAPIADPFRAPPSPYAAGNRGIEYATAPGTVVRAASAGTVVFAGMVGGTLHVVVRHPDGVRTSYSFLRTAFVHRGDAVSTGTPVGVAGARVHFGARVGDVYIDPATLFESGARSRVHLVPDRDEPSGSK